MVIFFNFLGGVVVYNFGIGNVRLWVNFDVGIMDGDYSNDVIVCV